MRNVKSNSVAGATNCSAMETGYHSKKRNSNLFLSISYLLLSLGLASVVFVSCEKEEIANLAVTDIILDNHILLLTVGEDYTLTAKILPADITDKTTVWTSSDESKATVTNGKVTAVAVGNATITVKAGDKTDTCKVTVRAPDDNENTITIIENYPTEIRPDNKKAIQRTELVKKSFYFGEYNHYTGRSNLNGAKADRTRLMDSNSRPILWDYKGFDDTADVALSRFAVDGEMYFNGADAAGTCDYSTNNYGKSAIQRFLNNYNSTEKIYDAYGNSVSSFANSNTFSGIEWGNGLKSVNIITGGNILNSQKVFLPWAENNNNNTAIYWSTSDNAAFKATTQIGTGKGWSVANSTDGEAKNSTGQHVDIPSSGDVVSRGIDGKGTPYSNGPVAVNFLGATSYMSRSAGDVIIPGIFETTYSTLIPDGKSTDKDGYYHKGYGIRPEISLDIENIIDIVKVDNVRDASADNYIPGGMWNYDPGLTASGDTDKNNYRLTIHNATLPTPKAPITGSVVFDGTNNIVIPNWEVPTGEVLAYKVIDKNTGKMIDKTGASDYVHAEMASGVTTLTVNTTGLTANGAYQLVVWGEKNSGNNKSDEASDTIVFDLQTP